MRYERQLPLFGEEGQRKLSESKIAIIGCGGLGSAVITALASAGAGHLLLVDGDVPNSTNLNRQFIYRECQEEDKASLAKRWAESLNTEIEINCCSVYLQDDNTDMLDEYDILVDCLDSIKARKILNRYAVEKGKVLVHGGVSGMQGQVTVVVPGMTPCLECILRDVSGQITPPSVCSATMLIGSIEANEVIKIVTGIGESLAGKLLTIDLESNTFDVIDMVKNDNCKVCSLTQY